ncbi:CrcB-like protein-domain-containing protein [Aspergillus karnatakaensis]|uniref:FluC/FEX family fluoride channel n=1 Tax=Aspergillus karnatakaensis TaxID=1810916 RepID=UPI003CCDD43E
MPPGNAVTDDAVEHGLTETQAPPPTAETAPQRRVSSSPNGFPTVDHTNADKPEPYPDRIEPVREPLSSSATHLYTLSYLVFFSIFGTLARLGLQALTFYPGAPVVTGVLWANVGGSLIMGFLLEDKNIFREEWGTPRKSTTSDDPSTESARHKTTKKTIPLYIGLTTGFCGSFTSFSSFIRDIFLALSNDLADPSRPSNTPSPRHGGYSVMSVLAVLLTQVSLSLSALIFGSHLALALDRFLLPPTLPFRITRKVIDPLFAFLAWGCWIGSTFLAIFPPENNWRGRAVFAIIFAPLGCLLRFYLSALNTRIPSFPLGTFAVNIFGTIILAMCYDLQHVDGIGSSSSSAASASASILVSCQVLQGIMDGFCGSATTVSTWVSELNGLKRRLHAYVYGGVSVGVALAFFVVISGSLRWTIGFGTAVCE